MRNTNRRRSNPSTQNTHNNHNSSQGSPGGVNELTAKAGKAIGASPEEIKAAAQSGDIEKIKSKLTPAQSEQLSRLLSDENAAKRLLSSPQAQAILKSLQKK